MAITTYSELQTAIENWLGHTNFTARVPEFISLFEAAAVRRLKVRETTTTASITMSGGSGSLPTDYLAMKRVVWPGSEYAVLEYAHPDWFYSRYPTTDQGTPSVYTIEGSTIKVRPVDNTSLSVLYVQRTSAVSGTLNWLFTYNPDVYLFGSLAEAEAFGVNDPRMAMWKERRDEIFEELKRQDFNNRAPMAIRVMGAHP